MTTDHPDDSLPTIDLGETAPAVTTRRLPAVWIVAAAVAVALAAGGVFAARNYDDDTAQARVARVSAQAGLDKSRADLQEAQSELKASQAALAQQRTRARVIKAATERTIKAGADAVAAIDTLVHLTEATANARIANNVSSYNALVGRANAQQTIAAGAIMDFTRAQAALELLIGDNGTLA